MDTIRKKMYLILREDLAYKYIQGGHALAQFALEHPDEFTDWGNEYLICLSVFNGKALKEIQEEFLLNGSYVTLTEDYGFFNELIKYSTFVEPDIESELPTAIACYHDGSKDTDKILNKIIGNLSLASR